MCFAKKIVVFIQTAMERKPSI